MDMPNPPSVMDLWELMSLVEPILYSLSVGPEIIFLRIHSEIVHSLVIHD